MLYIACRAHMTGDFRFVCLTDDATGIVPQVETFPIPDMGLSDFNWKKGGWAKLCVFMPELYDITGRCLFLDLDSIIAPPIDDLFTYPGEVVCIDSSARWKQAGAAGTPVAMSSVFAFTAGAQPELFTRFMADHGAAVAKYRIEQSFIQGELGTGALTFWPRDWVVSFKYHLRRPVGLGWVLFPKPPGPEARVIAFHGEPRPIALVRRGIWGIGPHWGRGRVPWAVDYWRRFGGDPERD